MSQGTFRDGITLGELQEENLWLDRLKDLAENDPGATQNWYMPLHLLDYVGFAVEDLLELSYESFMDEDKNEKMNAAVVQWIEGRMEYNRSRMNKYADRYTKLRP